MVSTTTTTYLEQRRDAMHWQPAGDAHTPHWRFVPADERFTWIMDGTCAVGLLDSKEGNFELRVADPWSNCPTAEIPKHYHTCTYVGLRVITSWRLRVWNAQRTRREFTWHVDGDTAVFELHEAWDDGSHGVHIGRLRFDPQWGAYVVDSDAALVARRAVTDQEFCNLIPAGIGDTRPGRNTYQHLLWVNRDGELLRMGKNPLWFDSVGAQDSTGQKSIANGGFMGWVAEPKMNPVIEILHADPMAGCMTCDALMDEHLMLAQPAGGHNPDGWFHFEVSYRLFSIPQVLAETLAREAEDFTPGPMLAWKFQYAPHSGPIAADLDRVELPGFLPNGKQDMNTPVSWDAPYPGQLWTPSSCPEADLYYDPSIGHAGHRSLRVTAVGGENRFTPGSGPTLLTEEGKTYRVSGYIRTEGNVQAWLEGNEILFQTFRPVETHATAKVGPDSDWTYVETSFTARGEDAPFAAVFIVADGDGYAWFDELAFEEM